jgi:hypothetical protein
MDSTLSGRWKIIFRASAAGPAVPGGVLRACPESASASWAGQPARSLIIGGRAVLHPLPLTSFPCTSHCGLRPGVITHGEKGHGIMADS